MYAVIFKASIKKLDQVYLDTSERMRELAQNKYGCVDFTSLTENRQDEIHELTISYWETLEQIEAWKQDKQHQAAQQRGKTDWYKSYQVEIVEIIKNYKS